LHNIYVHVLRYIEQRTSSNGSLVDVKGAARRAQDRKESVFPNRPVYDDIFQSGPFSPLKAFSGRAQFRNALFAVISPSVFSCALSVPRAAFAWNPSSSHLRLSPDLVTSTRTNVIWRLQTFFFFFLFRAFSLWEFAAIHSCETFYITRLWPYLVFPRIIFPRRFQTKSIRQRSLKVHSLKKNFFLNTPPAQRILSRGFYHVTA